jgi:3-mercaptopyruvate sulfurtransferase SseA
MALVVGISAAMYGMEALMPGALVAGVLTGVPHDRPIVAYCSVGYRSSAYCARLLNDGFTDVHDLRGFIFQWANAGFPVYRNGKIAYHVHPYNYHWGQLLKRSLWAFHPPMKKD